MTTQATAQAQAALRQLITGRHSVRQFIPDKVPSLQQISDLLELASHAPSGGNLQPWKVYVLHGAARDRLVQAVQTKMDEGTFAESTEYHVYPPDIKPEYKARRTESGRLLYEAIGVHMKDTPSKLKQLSRNYAFFDAPVGLIVTLDRQMGPGQFVDVGMFLQTFCLGAESQGMGTCCQEAWANHHSTVTEICKIPPHEMVFCGVSVGYEDKSAKINSYRVPRAPLRDFVTVVPAEQDATQSRL